VKWSVGKDRKNLRFEYGSLIQGYRVLGFGDWGNAVYAVGRTRNEVKPYFVEAIAEGVTTATWGHVAKTQIWNDIADDNDLRRRARKYAREASAIGKRMAIAFRVKGLLPVDGWDICDSVQFIINDGAVATERYGSGGWWTIWGWEWRWYSDGHDEMTLVTLPRNDDEAPVPDIIPSAPVHNQPEWAVKNGPPAVLIRLDTGRELDTGLKLDSYR
jgi:hypothetical protein